MDEKELAKQLSVYADSITAFSFVQGIGLFVLMGHDLTFACNLVKQWWIAEAALVLATMAYAAIVYLCHKHQKPLLGQVSTEASTILGVIQKVRWWIVIGIGFAEMAFVAYSRFCPSMTCPGPAK